MQDGSLLAELMTELELALKYRGDQTVGARIKAIADQAGVDENWIKSVRSRKVKDPGVIRVEAVIKVLWRLGMIEKWHDRQLTGDQGQPIKSGPRKRVEVKPSKKWPRS
jgi:hypothetical protein